MNFKQNLFRGRGVLALAAVAAFGLAACDDSPTDIPIIEPAAVEITPESVTLTALGETYELLATVLDQNGQEIEGQPVEWSTSDDEVVMVDEDGVLEAMGEGTAIITATSGEVSAEVEVVVSLDEQD